jgi:hypothetical protein
VPQNEPTYEDPAVQALIRAYVACRVALDALPDLPGDVYDVVAEPVRTLCGAVGDALGKIEPHIVRDDP